MENLVSAARTIMLATVFTVTGMFVVLGAPVAALDLSTYLVACWLMIISMDTCRIAMVLSSNRDSNSKSGDNK